MSYKITIQRTGKKSKNIGSVWQVIDTKEVRREQNLYDHTDPEEKKTRIKDVLGYTPENIEEVDVTEQIFEQTVSDMDLKKVIKAINNLE